MKKEKRSHLVKAYLTKDEYDTILKWSIQSGLTISTFIQRVCTAQKIESKIDQQTRIELRKINADFGRLGGLLKLAISENKNVEEVSKLLFQIDILKDEFRRKIRILW